ncbi:hypothetical protein FH972_001380 [Carpinus fangiana]|uniref:Uncharacterized protein n=1 Tax=Carpinus fangiana TaxID=176857 RepID=A0A5N6QDF4_9ROSI|nr:hypothetical protein FH972_001380 [Carpinus fangiana]
MGPEIEEEQDHEAVATTTMELFKPFLFFSTSTATFSYPKSTAYTGRSATCP